MKRDYSALIWGVLIVAAGVVFGGNALGLWYIDVFFDGWWTLFLIVPGLISILKHGFNWGAGIIVIIGLALLLDSQELFDSTIMWKLIWPVLIIGFGISLISSFFRKDKKFKVEINTDDSVSYTHHANNSYRSDDSQYAVYRGVFSGDDIKNSSDDLKSVTIDIVFGGFDIDLRDAKINQDINMTINCVFGGVDVYVPDDVDIVIVSGTPVLGGFSHRRNKGIPGAHKIFVKYVTVFGGADIN